MSQANQRRVLAELGGVFTFVHDDFRSRLKVLRSSADLQLYDSEFQTEGADMDMGWIYPWVGLGWVGLGRVRSNMIHCRTALVPLVATTSTS